MLLRATDSQDLYRVLWLSENCETGYIFNVVSLALPVSVFCADLLNGLDNGVYSVETNDPYIIVSSEGELSGKERAMRDSVWYIMKAVVENEPNIYDRKMRGRILTETSAATGKQFNLLYRYLRFYWQRGKTKNAFLPQYNNCGAPGKERKAGDIKRGRPSKYGSTNINADDSTRAIFEKAVKKYYHTREEHTLKYAYDMMVAEHYTQYVTEPDGKKKAILLPIEQIPTIRQFRYWYQRKYDVKETLSKRKGVTKFELEHRAVLGKSDFGVMGPGAKYQIDATVGDVYLVSRFNRANIIGRPVIYFIVDVFSRMVAGMYVGLEGPSWAGAMMALANAMSDKVKFCAEYGIEIAPEEWPCNGVPGAYLADRGEMESKSAETLINALNVRVENAPPYRGDMKGIIEQYFRTTNETALVRLPGHVKKDLGERGGKDYRLDAKLDIYQLTKILIECVRQHNSRHLLETYERTADMIADGVVPIPIELWNWGITHCSGALRSFPEDKIKLALMPADKATVTVKGVKYKNLYYICERAAKEFWFEKARNKTWKVDISYDPRNMSTLYVRNSDGTTENCRLSEWQDKYAGKTLDEILYLHEVEKALHRQNAPKEMASKADLTAAIDSVIAEAEEMARQTVLPKSKAERTKNIRDNRRAEKAANRLDETFSLGDDEQDFAVSTQPKQQVAEKPIDPVMAEIMKQLEERLGEK
jgi:hypothetical protein